MHIPECAPLPAALESVSSVAKINYNELLKWKDSKFVFILSTSRLRLSVSEGCLSGQERTLAMLLEQAFRIKEEVAAGLHSTQGSIQVEALSRKLLESHILTITHIVRQLSIDIQVGQWCRLVEKIWMDVSSRKYPDDEITFHFVD